MKRIAQFLKVVAGPLARHGTCRSVRDAVSGRSTFAFNGSLAGPSATLVLMLLCVVRTPPDARQVPLEQEPVAVQKSSSSQTLPLRSARTQPVAVLHRSSVQSLPS